MSGNTINSYIIFRLYAVVFSTSGIGWFDPHFYMYRRLFFIYSGQRCSLWIWCHSYLNTALCDIDSPSCPVFGEMLYQNIAFIGKIRLLSVVALIFCHWAYAAPKKKMSNVPIIQKSLSESLNKMRCSCRLSLYFPDRFPEIYHPVPLKFHLHFLKKFSAGQLLVQVQNQLQSRTVVDNGLRQQLTASNFSPREYYQFRVCLELEVKAVKSVNPID